MSKKDTKKVENTVRVVKESDITSDPRLVDAGVVVGQLYDFSNLVVLPKGASFSEEEVQARNELKADAVKRQEDSLKTVNDAPTDTAAQKVAQRDAQVVHAATIAARDAAKE